MKNSVKKISVSIMVGTIILGSVMSANAASFNSQFTYRTYKTFTFKNIGKVIPTNCKNNIITDKTDKKPTIPNNNNTTPGQNNQAENNQKPQAPVVEDTQKPVLDNSVLSIESEVLRLVNVERSKAGLAPLKMSSELSNVARKKSQDMADKNYFDHNSPTYGSPFDMMKQFGIKYTAAGENIAKGHNSAEAVMNGWMNSAGHKANILSSKFGTLGVGYVNKNGTTYWTQMFTN